MRESEKTDWGMLRDQLTDESNKREGEKRSLGVRNNVYDFRMISIRRRRETSTAPPARGFPLLQTVRPPTLVPLLSTSFAQLPTPLCEHRILQPRKIAMFFVVRVGKSPGEFAADDVRFIKIWADDGHWQERYLICRFHILGAANGVAGMSA